jgi:hypothetical protein
MAEGLDTAGTTEEIGPTDVTVGLERKTPDCSGEKVTRRTVESISGGLIRGTLLTEFDGIAIGGVMLIVD